MHDPDRQRVHATALEGHIYVLQKKKRNTFNTFVLNFSMTKTFRQSTQTRFEKTVRLCEVSDLWLGLNILAEQPLLIEGVAGLPCDGIYGALVDLLLDCTQQQEERLTHCFLQNVAESCSQKSDVLILLNQCFCNHCNLY